MTRTTAPRWILFVGLAAAVVVLDQATKAIVAANLSPGQSVDVVGDLVRIVFGQNNGGLFGMFRGQAPVFAVVSLGVVVLIVVYEAHAGASVAATVALGLLLGGALGNLVDRVRVGYVLDFVDAGIGNLRWYTFNVADAAISTSIVLLVALAVLGEWDDRQRRVRGSADGPLASRGEGPQ
ncbi:MAG TPA: signal peptidase II [Candidatus Limnocylindrales bacterium]|nr:signal peptidase II [Candidatus Limnocylindrales bacterium]